MENWANQVLSIVYEKGWETRSKNLDKQKIGYKVFTNFGGGGVLLSSSLFILEGNSMVNQFSMCTFKIFFTVACLKCFAHTMANWIGFGIHKLLFIVMDAMWHAEFLSNEITNKRKRNQGISLQVYKTSIFSIWIRYTGKIMNMFFKFRHVLTDIWESSRYLASVR